MIQVLIRSALLLRGRFSLIRDVLNPITCLTFLLLLILLITNNVSAQDIVPPPAAPAVSDVETRLNELEAINQLFARQLEEMQDQNDSLTRELQSMQSGVTQNRKKGEKSLTRADLLERQPQDIRTDEPFSAKDLSEEEANPFEKALVWGTDDDEWTFNFHNETQIDIRTYTHDHSAPVNQFGFYLPRMRLIFNGSLTKPIEYNVSINKGLGSLDLLDSYLNFNYDSRFQLRIGRYRVPFTYDWYALSNQFLTTPERSVFALNRGYNRNTAAMLHGELLDDHVDYAIALANGPRNSYFDENASKDILTYLNVRPFASSERWPALQHLNLGGSYSYGKQDQNPQPLAFHTSASASSSAGTQEGVPSFLILNSNVVEQGERSQWEAHLAYYYKQLTLQAAIDGALNTYAFSDAPGSVGVDTKAWHIQFGYFLTGEEITRRTFVDVLRPFDLRQGKRGPGALELQARFDHFQLSRNVFTSGLADAALWTNRVNTIDCGVNWYLNRYVKIDFDWQHCVYGDPVEYAPGRSSNTNDLFWIRFQNYF